MTAELLLPALVGLLPVLCFLAALLYLDSYKLVKLRAVVAVVACGAAVAGGELLRERRGCSACSASTSSAFSRYVAPVVEELLKGAGHRRADPRAPHRLPRRRGDLRLRRRHRLRAGREPLLPATDRARRRHRHLDRARLRHRDHARRRDRDLRGDGPGDAASARARDARSHSLPGFALAVAAALGVQPPAGLAARWRRWPSWSCCRRCSTSCSSAASGRWATGSARASTPTPRCWS